MPTEFPSRFIYSCSCPARSLAASTMRAVAGRTLERVRRGKTPGGPHCARNLDRGFTFIIGGRSSRSLGRRACNDRLYAALKARVTVRASDRRSRIIASAPFAISAPGIVGNSLSRGPERGATPRNEILNQIRGEISPPMIDRYNSRDFAAEKFCPDTI